MATNDNRHMRRGLGMKRHYTPSHAGGHIDQRTMPTPTVAQQAVDNNQSGLAMQTRPPGLPISQGPLPRGNRGGDRQDV